MIVWNRTFNADKIENQQILRNAITAYNPDVPTDMEDFELLELVSTRVKEAITDTRKTRKNLDKTLKKLAVGAV